MSNPTRNSNNKPNFQVFDVLYLIKQLSKKYKITRYITYWYFNNVWKFQIFWFIIVEQIVMKKMQNVL